MNQDEAKLLLSAYRPNGSDALDPVLREALRCAERDPALGNWFAAQCAFDAAMARRLRQVPPPPGLRDQLRAGLAVQAQERSRQVRRSWGLASFVMMAALVLAAGLSSGAAGWANALPAHPPPYMNETFLYTLTTTGFGIALLHAAIPTHWLPFVIIGRARGWSRRQIFGSVALAGGGHILITTVLGVSLAWFGFELNERFEQTFHWVAGAILVALGAWLAFRAPHGHACHHCQGSPNKLLPEASDRAALWGLFLTLTLSPCELFLPIYLTAAPYGWPGVAFLSAVLAVATLGGMLILTWLTLRGVQRLRWSWLEQLDGRAIGSLLCLLGVVTAVFAH
ncbi:MAG TPA: hypothetical protein VG734_21620 [Lacunisphaera sp.]|nr:hypothetical protein [Lacunisphaera sp.]